MTTIAFDGNMLVADRMRSASELKQRFDLDTGKEITESYNLSKKLLLPKSEVLFEGSKIIATVGAGFSRSIDVWRKAILAGANLEVVYAFSKELHTDSIPRATLLVWTEAGFWELKFNPDEFSKKEITTFPYVTGSGGMAAMAMMKIVGFSPVDAVLAASDCDPYTGGVVDFVHRDDTAKITSVIPSPNTLEAIKKSIKVKIPQQPR